jgi:hypothetical protein
MSIRTFKALSIVCNEKQGELVKRLIEENEMLKEQVIISEMKEEYYRKAFCSVVEEDTVTHVICKLCNNVLPPHTVEQHLDIHDPIHTCPHH